MLCYIMLLCYDMLCYVMLCYVMLCYVMLCYVMLCYVMLCYVMLCYVMLCYDLWLKRISHLIKTLRASQFQPRAFPPRANPGHLFHDESRGPGI